VSKNLRPEQCEIKPNVGMKMRVGWLVSLFLRYYGFETVGLGDNYVLYSDIGALQNHEIVKPGFPRVAVP
jgi:hypothetical protein